MTYWLSLALRSALSRRGPILLVVLSVSVSVSLVLAVIQLRTDTRASFSRALGGVDLIVGPRASPVELMLYTVFHLGRATRNIPFETVERVGAVRGVRWVVPLQLGDSYRGHAVIGTTDGFFDHVGAGGEPLRFAAGGRFSAPFDVVLGARVAARFDHRLGDLLVMTHGQGGPMGQHHDDRPFVVVGMLQPTGTPIDRAVLITLAGFEAIHQGWELGMPPPRRDAAGGAPTQADAIEAAALVPVELTAALVGLTSRAAVFSVRRGIESLPGEPLMAVMPGVALDDLWRVIEVGENALVLVGWLVAIGSMLGVAASLLIALAARRRELAILRALGAHPRAILGFVMLESLLVFAAGIVGGWLLLQAGIAGLQETLRAGFGIVVEHRLPDAQGWTVLVGLLGIGVLGSLIPAWRAYRLALVDGLNPPSA